ncbi:MAG: YqgE/AlgH family protein [Burkholderiaceae bacterium]|jgi:putative transcriptional regulator|nr:YqgE/AlgH family protein [Burkholderiaceae bacterium]
MADAAQLINLTNHFLIAMPGMQDDMFARSVVYVCEHGEHGALGLIINKPGEISLADLFQRVDLPLQRKELGEQPVFHGGPLQTERGFVLHDPVVVEGLESDQTIYASTLTVPGGLEMTTSKDVLEALSSGGGPRRVLVTLGYSSWGGGQIESEIARNSWLTVNADANLVFDAPVAKRYDLALSLLGLQSWTIAPGAGHA